MQHPEVLQEWDWLAELRRQERSQAWLARRTYTSPNTVSRYARGVRHAPMGWLVRAVTVLMAGNLDRR